MPPVSPMTGGRLLPLAMACIRDAAGGSRSPELLTRHLRRATLTAMPSPEAASRSVADRPSEPADRDAAAGLLAARPERADLPALGSR